MASHVPYYVQHVMYSEISKVFLVSRPSKLIKGNAPELPELPTSHNTRALTLFEEANIGALHVQN